MVKFTRAFYYNTCEKYTLGLISSHTRTPHTTWTDPFTCWGVETVLRWLHNHYSSAEIRRLAPETRRHPREKISGRIPLGTTRPRHSHWNACITLYVVCITYVIRSWRSLWVQYVLYCYHDIVITYFFLRVLNFWAKKKNIAKNFKKMNPYLLLPGNKKWPSTETLIVPWSTWNWSLRTPMTIIYSTRRCCSQK